MDGDLDGFELITDDEILNSIRKESIEQTLKYMLIWCHEYFKSMGRHATFRGWIATDFYDNTEINPQILKDKKVIKLLAHKFPEYVDIDHRLKITDNSWINIWNQCKNEYEQKLLKKAKKNKRKKTIKKNRQKLTKKS